MEYVIVSIFLPAAGKTYELRLPLDLNVREGTKMIARAISSLCEEEYLPSNASFLAWRLGGELLNTDRTFRQCELKNGSKLMLI